MSGRNNWYTERLWDESVGGGASSVLAAEEEVDTGRTGALRERERARELDARTLRQYSRDKGGCTVTYKSAAEMPGWRA